MVLFVFREDYYVGAKEPKRPTEGDEAKIFEDHARWATDMERVFGLAALIVAKQRPGATATVPLKFEPELSPFSALAVSDYRHSASYCASFPSPLLVGWCPRPLSRLARAWSTTLSTPLFSPT